MKVPEADSERAVFGANPTGASREGSVPVRALRFSPPDLLALICHRKIERFLPGKLAASLVVSRSITRLIFALGK